MYHVLIDTSVWLDLAENQLQTLLIDVVANLVEENRYAAYPANRAERVQSELWRLRLNCNWGASRASQPARFCLFLQLAAQGVPFFPVLDTIPERDQPFVVQHCSSKPP